MKTFILKINADNKEEAIKKIREGKVEFNEYDLNQFWEETDWVDKAKNYASDILYELEDEIKEELEKIDLNKTEDEIFDELDEKIYLRDAVWETVDGRFIYNDWEDLREPLDCIDQLRHWEETDAGLWEGREPEETITIKATATLINAVTDFLNREVKNYIKEFKKRMNLKKKCKIKQK